MCLFGVFIPSTVEPYIGSHAHAHAHGFLGATLLFMGVHGSWEVLANLDHEKDDAPAPPQKKRRNDDPTSMSDEYEDELEEIHDGGLRS